LPRPHRPPAHLAAVRHLRGAYYGRLRLRAHGFWRDFGRGAAWGQRPLIFANPSCRSASFQAVAAATSRIFAPPQSQYSAWIWCALIHVGIGFVALAMFSLELLDVGERFGRVDLNATSG
jgi:hypothetical protein